MTDLPHILTLSEVADFLGVDTHAVAQWAHDELLQVCARSESGELLFYRWRVERDGPKLAATEPIRWKNRSGRRGRALLFDARQLSCGCALVGEGEAAGQAIWLCPAARTLQTVEQLAGLLAAAAPRDSLFGSLAQIAGTALANHLTPPNAADSSGVNASARIGRRRKDAA